MFYQLKLPYDIVAKLTAASAVQLAVFEWAAQTKTPLPEDLNAWLRLQPQVGTRADEIFRWVCSSQSRLACVIDFARADDRTAKMNWHKRIAEEHKNLLQATIGCPVSLSHKDENLTNEQRTGKRLLIRFYNEFRSPSGFPKEFFDDGKKFNDQNYLQLLYNANPRILLCSFCQEMAYSSMTSDHIYTDIDHFLPKDLYPHFAIHPYNLIPVCHICNSGFKIDRDPLKGSGKTRRDLATIWMPYRHLGLSDLVALEIGYDDDNRPIFRKLTSRFPDNDITPSLELLNEIYRTLERWQERRDVISEKLFRRMRDFLRFYTINDPNTLHTDAAQYFDELLYAFVHDDMEREPYAFPMLWLLAQMITTELPDSSSAFSKELRIWHGALALEAKDRREFGAKLRSWRR